MLALGFILDYFTRYKTINHKALLVLIVYMSEMLTLHYELLAFSPLHTRAFSSLFYFHPARSVVSSVRPNRITFIYLPDEA